MNARHSRIGNKPQVQFLLALLVAGTTGYLLEMIPSLQQLSALQEDLPYFTRPLLTGSRIQIWKSTKKTHARKKTGPGAGLLWGRERESDIYIYIYIYICMHFHYFK